MAFECREKARAPGRGTGGALGQRAALMPTPVRGRIGMNVAPTLWSGADRHERSRARERVFRWDLGVGRVCGSDSEPCKAPRLREKGRPDLSTDEWGTAFDDKTRRTA